MKGAIAMEQTEGERHDAAMWEEVLAECSTCAQGIYISLAQRHADDPVLEAALLAAADGVRAQAEAADRHDAGSMKAAADRIGAQTKAVLDAKERARRAGGD